MKNPIVAKPYSNNFDNTSMYDVQEKIQIHTSTYRKI